MDTPHTFISIESGTLARPRGLALDSVGRLFILDQIDRRIVVVSPQGDIQEMIGGPGEGPGEFSLPLFLGVNGERVRVFDFGQGSVQSFSTAGEYLGQSRPDISGVPSRVSFGPGEKLAYSGMSVPDSGGLAVVLDGSTGKVSYIGDPVSEETTIPPTLLEQVHRRELPNFMRNNALPVFTSDGGLWVFLQTEAVLKRFDPSGRLVSEDSIAIPEMDLITEEFFDWYAEIDAPDMLRYFSYIEDATVSDGSLFLLWNVPGGYPAPVTVHDSTGRMTARISLRGTESQTAGWDQGPPSRRLAVDGDRQRLYLMEQDALTVWWYPLPPDLVVQ